jgi:hypothetical protein
LLGSSTRFALRPAALALAVSLGAILAWASMQALQLQGTMLLRGQTAIDPPPDERPNTHASLLLRGRAAAAIYEALEAIPELDECRADGSLTKRAGQIACTRDPKGASHECGFVIDLVRGHLAEGDPC